MDAPVAVQMFVAQSEGVWTLRLRLPPTPTRNALSSWVSAKNAAEVRGPERLDLSSSRKRPAQQTILNESRDRSTASRMHVWQL